MNTNKLQLLRCETIFESREQMVERLNGKITYGDLRFEDGEPFVMFYKDGEEVCLVLCVAKSDTTYEMFDIAYVESKLAELEEEMGELTEEMAQLKDAVAEIKESLAQEILDRIAADEQEKAERVAADDMLAALCGFVPDERHPEELVYLPENEILKDAESLAQAIELVADYAVANNITYTFASSNTIQFTVEENENEHIISADVILSTETRHDDGGDNYGHDDNILVKYADGLAANVDLEYNNEEGVLEFTKSSTATGMHKTTKIAIPQSGISVEDAQSMVNEALEAAKEYADVQDEKIIGHDNAGVDEISIYGVRNRVDSLIGNEEDGVGEKTIWGVSNRIDTLVETAIEKAKENANEVATEIAGTALGEAKVYTDNSIDKVVGNALDGSDELTLNGVRNRVDNALADAKAYSDSNLGTAKSYTDTALETAKTYADTNSASTLADAKAYADEKDALLLGHDDAGVDEVSIYGVRNRVDKVADDAANAAAQALDDAKSYTDTALVSTAADALAIAKTYADDKDALVIGHSDAGVDEISVYGVRNRVDKVADDANAYSDNILNSAKEYSDNNDASILANAKEYTDTALANADVAGAAANALTDAKAYADEKDAILLGHDNAGVDEISIYGVRNRVDAVATTATNAAADALTNAKDYTDSALAGADVAGAAANALTDAKAYADEKDDDVKALIVAETERAKAAEKRALIAEVVDGKGINLTRSIDENGTVLEAESNISGLSNNIISLKDDGLYVPKVEVAYNGVTNTIIFRNGESEVSYQLAGVTAINDLRYDPASKNLIFSIKKEDGTNKDVNVSLENLVPSITSGSNEDSPIQIIVNKDNNDSQFTATITAELNNVWDKDIKASFHVDSTDADNTIIHTESLSNVHEVLEHLLQRIKAAFDAIAEVKKDIEKLKALKINGIKAYDEDHNGVVDIKGSDIQVGGDGAHKADTVDESIEDLYSADESILDKIGDIPADKTVKDYIDAAKAEAIASGAEVNIAGGDNNKYMSMTNTTSDVDGHHIYTLDAKVVNLAVATESNTGLADANDVKKAIADAIDAIDIANVEVKAGESINVVESTDETDGHTIYTISVIESNIIDCGEF